MNAVNILYFFAICFGCANPSPESAGHDHIPTPGTLEQTGPVPGADRLDHYLPMLRGKAVACVINHSSLIGDTHLIDTLISHDIQIRRVFAPEHGFRGGADAGAQIADERDSQTGLPVISLYGAKKKPASEDIQDVDVVLFDIQDVGVRFYTYISTLHYVMEACAENGKKLIVLDRPNPNGYYVDGPVLEPEFRSFVGMHEIPVVYGMSIGELAQLINGESWLASGIQCDLMVIPCAHYDHKMTYELPVPPSPNLPNLRSVLLYPSLCFFEGTHVSVGRGTDRQFQVIGHPAYPDQSFTFKPVSMPGAKHPPHENLILSGTDLTKLTVPDIVAWKQLNLSWLIEYHRHLAPGDAFFIENDFFEKLAGTASLRTQLEAGWSEEEMRASWQEDLTAFKTIRMKYLLYPDFED